VLSGNAENAKSSLTALLAQQQRNPKSLNQGEVYLIGAGPGDPDLMTFKALRLLQSADVVLYDRLVNPAITDLARRDAERIYVGKQRSDHSVPQTRINQRLLDLARDGRRVARLKGGDPFIFGRGGEEIELLARHQIPFQVVPGITAASGAASYAGIPLTHREHAQSVRFVAGYLKDNRLEHRWEEFLSPNETLVFYMGLAGLEVICSELVAHGRDPATPVAVIERATLPEQRVITGTLSSISEIVARSRPVAHTLIIIGSVVDLQSELAWFGPDTPQTTG
jgi:uroporphyrin-III C-methyltransferase/precorrin-2 dehydrogenase/sirohydrochlorin ferrochelatase